MDHSKLTFRPKEGAPVPQRQVSTAIQPQLPAADENATATVESPTDTSNATGATLQPTSTSSSGMAPLLGSNSCSCRLISVSATNSYPKWCEHTREYLMHDSTKDMQVLPIEKDRLAEFIRDDAVRAGTSLPNLARIWTVKFSCYEEGTRESEVVQAVWHLIQNLDPHHEARLKKREMANKMDELTDDYLAHKVASETDKRPGLSAPSGTSHSQPRPMAIMKKQSASNTYKPGTQPAASFAATGKSYTNPSSRLNGKQPYAFGQPGGRVPANQTMAQPDAQPGESPLFDGANSFDWSKVGHLNRYLPGFPGYLGYYGK